MGSPHVTPSRRELVLSLHAAGMTSAAIVERVGLSPASVWRILRDNGLKPNPPIWHGATGPHASTRASAESDAPEQSWFAWADAARRRRAMRPDEIIVGAKSICAYMRIAAINTLERWVRDYGFPAIKRPDGKWLTSRTAIDEWIWLAAELHAEGRTQMDRIAARAYHATVRNRDTRSRTRPYTGSMIERHAQRGSDPSMIIVQSKVKAIKKLHRTPPPFDISEPE